jgi:hypothetical protein
MAILDQYRNRNITGIFGIRVQPLNRKISLAIDNLIRPRFSRYTTILGRSPLERLYPDPDHTYPKIANMTVAASCEGNLPFYKRSLETVTVIKTPPSNLDKPNKHQAVGTVSNST